MRWVGRARSWSAVTCHRFVREGPADGSRWLNLQGRAKAATSRCIPNGASASPARRAYCCALVTVLAAASASAKELPAPVTVGEHGRLVYAVEPGGDRVIDFSHAGYRGGGVPLPEVPVRVVVEPADGDDGARIQAALDQVAQLELDREGRRGAVVLARGRFEVAGQLRIAADGVVLRGMGSGEDGTTLVATGTSRRALITIGRDPEEPELGAAIRIADDYVPVGANTVRLADVSALAPGMRVRIRRPSPESWIAHLGMDEAPGRQPYRWKAGAFDVMWDRVITRVEGDHVTLDAPLTVALDPRFGRAELRPWKRDDRLREIGVENLRCESAFDPANLRDEEHAWDALAIDNARDVWIADVTGRHFAGALVRIGADAARVTVQDCAFRAPVSEQGGYRRMAFHTSGQQTLFLRCEAESARHPFSVGYLAAGPNVFLECRALDASSFSGPVGSWASGVLFDNVTIDGAALRLDNLETWNQGVGWNAANSVIWASSAAEVICRSPPGAVNWAVGVWGQFIGDGRWSQTNEFMEPDSLYRAQLRERGGEDAVAALDASPAGRDPGSTPGFAGAMARNPDASPSPQPREPAQAAPLQLRNGWLAAGETLLTGSQVGGAWWRGRLEPARAAEFGPALTRFAPGRTGTGLTDDLRVLVTRMAANGRVAFRHHYGLWYDRRRIDHQMIRRPDGDVYPPFFEQPFARSGQGRAWDGLSRYDLTKYNPWYFDRLREFAALGRAHGVVLINAMYFQHNILESGAHWVDSPWRPVNNINHTGFTEPPPFAGDTIRMAAEFYDVTHPVRRDLHRAYIRHCLDALADESNVIHTLTAENSGPLAFMEFWLDVVAGWQRDTGRDPLIALSAPKDVQDAILADGERARLIDVIDLTYWFRTDGGAEFAPPGGTTLAPRQHLRLWKHGRPSAASIAAMVHEYRTRLPDKAIISELPEADGWMFAASGGSFPKMPASTDRALRAAIVRMRPVAADDGARQWVLAEPGRGYFAVAAADTTITLDLRRERGEFQVRRINPATGAVTEGADVVSAGQVVNIPPGDRDVTVVWLTRTEPSP